MPQRNNKLSYANLNDLFLINEITTKMKRSTFLLLTIFLGLCFQSGYSQAIQKNRVIILSDIEADPDDAQSFVRLLLYANQIDIQGMVATTSCWQKSRVAPESIKKILKAYGSVQPNLNKHEAGFPTENALLQTVKTGLAKYGMQGVGKGQDSEGSEWIIKTLNANDPRPLHISVWGGVNTLAQALFKLKETKSAAEMKKYIAKLRVYTISDQDDSGIWLRNTFPDLHYIVSPGDDYGSSTWSAINNYIKGISNEEISNEWLAKNIQQGHGPLGAAYPDVAWGMEGDTPAYLNLILNGLNNPEKPEWGGWGGRYELYKPDFTKQKKGNSGVPFEPETRPIWTNTADNYQHYIPSNFGRVFKLDTMKYNNNKATLWRWREDFQNDFAARMDWCITDYKNANHPPVPVLKQPDEFTIKSGQGFGLDASDTYDPDGDSFGFMWYDYPEAGTYKKSIIDSPSNYNNVWLTAPDVEKEETIHIILKITDKGTPNLTRYKRIIVTVLPK